MIEVIWTFVVKPQAVERFKSAYGPEGEWSRLFEEYPGYRGTTLACDTLNPCRFVTVDRWDTEANYLHMQGAAAVEYARLDETFAGWTDSEVDVGTFVLEGS